MDKKKDSKKLNILKFDTKEEEKIELTEEELELKEKLIMVEDKMDSIMNIIASMEEDSSKITLFSTEAFETILSACAITSVSNILADYFGIPKNNLDDIF